jgi:ADP-L-glycero-D-manno-heptose 6-epimerase
MRALVTGAAGFIGSNLTRSLVERGFEVVAVDSLSSGVRDNLEGFPGKIVHWDMTAKPPDWGKFDAVFHHGDITDPRYPNDKEVLERNLACFRNVLEIARAGGRQLVYASTAGLYGNGPTPMREDQEKHLLTAYGRSKLEMDRIASEFYDDMRVVGLRYFNVYGPYEQHKGRAASMVWHLARQMAAGNRPRLFEWGDQKRDFIHVADVVEANFRALQGPSGVYNVGTGVASTFNELVEALNLALGTDLEPEYFPMPYESATYQGNTQADPRLAREKLGFSARFSLKEGVLDYVKWMRSKGLLGA